MSSAFSTSFNLELKKQFSYRADFWVNFLLHSVGRLTVAYFLWTSVFHFSNQPTIGGMTLQETLIYFFVALFVDLMARSSAQRVSLVMQEIYDGSLSRFLLYPVSFFDFKFSRVLTFVIMGLLQMSVGYALLAVFVGTNFDLFSVSAIVMGLIAIVPGILLYFIIAFTLEMVAFWADGVWSLNVILRFTSGFLGGGLMPITMFPETWQRVIKVLPFYAMLGAPTSAFLGKMSVSDLLIDLGISGLWLLVLLVIARWVWLKGIKQFSGVGM